MSSSKRKHQWHLLANVSDYSKSEKGFQSDEKLDDNDLEVAMINESFEEQLKHLLQFTNPKFDDTYEYKMEVSPPISSMLAPITPPSDKETDSGHPLDMFDLSLQLDRDLERMMWEGEDDPYRLTFVSPVPSHNGGCLSGDTVFQQQSAAFFALPSLLPFNNQTNIVSSFVSPFNEEQNSDESDAAAKSIAYDVVSSLFDGEPLYSSESFSDDEGSMVVNASILQVLQDDEAESELEQENTEATKENETAKSVSEESESIEFQPVVPTRNNSMPTLLSQMYAADEQTLPVFDSWEELGDSPVAAEKVYSEAKAVLRKIRAERRATQL